MLCTVDQDHQCSVCITDPRCTGSALRRLGHWSSADTSGHLREVVILSGLRPSQRPVLWLEQNSSEMCFYFEPTQVSISPNNEQVVLTCIIQANLYLLYFLL